MARKQHGRPNRNASFAKTMRMVAQGYGDAGASTSKRALKGFLPTSGSADSDIDAYNERIRQRARALYMSAPIATSAIRANRTNVVGTGLVPKPAIDAEFLGLTTEDAIRWQQHVEREFALWADSKHACDATGVNNFYGMQQLALISWLLSGDVFALIKRTKRVPEREPYGLRLHLIEADRVATPGKYPSYSLGSTKAKMENGHWCHDGVELDSLCNIVAYHIRNTYPGDPTSEPVKFTRVPAYGRVTGLPNILHMMDSERPEQYRGVSYLAQIIEPLLQLRRFTDAELVAAVVESFFTAFIKTEADPSDMPFDEMIPDGDPSIPSADNEYQMGPGQINVMLPGESVEFADPKRPSGSFEPFVRAICEQVGAALEIPADLLLKAFDSSYSASRAALMEAWKAFRMRREWFVDDFCAPVWEIWMSEAVALGRIKAPGFFTDPAIRKAYLKCNWIGPSQGQLDPTKEISAEIAAIQQGLTTRRDAAIRLNGSSWDANIEQVTYENELLAKANSYNTGTDLPENIRRIAPINKEGGDDAQSTQDNGADDGEPQSS